ncbi:GGDEF domain-containing protein [Acidaminobacter sp. JC074]|uniref:GGDEF domain-containing protein n=1 Tax=Acidaminobacter sp. JC074 TaxID=2530199 RepID=UPI001F0E3C89|nr:GGDEF domain-containing protein [Acidaminobacter sp. JC074]MCH4888395.1 GGDEF domain-containing protein [Acidaminobacter sp. JC074]
MRILNYILGAGIVENMKLSDEARLKVLNGSIFVAAFNILIYDIMFYFFARDLAFEMSWVRNLCALIIVSAWFLNKKGTTKYSIHILLIFSMISVFYVTYFYLGPDYGFQKFFITFSVFPFVYFSRDKTAQRFIYAISNLLVYFYLEVASYGHVFTPDFRYYNASIASFFNHSNIVIGFIAVVLALYMYEYIIGRDESALKSALEKASYHAEYDFLTDTLNRRVLSEYMRSNFTNKLSVIMWDVDDFKLINDVYGHAVGDDVLVAICQIVKEELPTRAKFSRWGGEEFLILLEDHHYDHVVSLAERIRIKVSQADILKTNKVTISIGVTSKRHDDSFKTLLGRVDELMYLAKANGKNIVRESI